MKIQISVVEYGLMLGVFLWNAIKQKKQSTPQEIEG